MAKILIIDDNETIRIGLEHTIKGMDHQPRYGYSWRSFFPRTGA